MDEFKKNWQAMEPNLETQFQSITKKMENLNLMSHQKSRNIEFKGFRLLIENIIEKKEEHDQLLSAVNKLKEAYKQKCNMEAMLALDPDQLNIAFDELKQLILTVQNLTVQEKKCENTLIQQKTKLNEAHQLFLVEYNYSDLSPLINQILQ